MKYVDVWEDTKAGEDFPLSACTYTIFLLRRWDSLRSRGGI